MMPSSHWLQLSYVCGSYDKVFLLGALNGSGLMNRVRRPPKVAEVRPGMDSRLSSSSNPRSTFRLSAIPGA